MPKEATENFLSTVINNCSRSENKYSWSYKMKIIIDNIERQSHKEVSSLFSDKFWNKYPTYRYWNTRSIGSIDDRLSHAAFLNDMISFVLLNKDNYPKSYKALVNDSQGIIHYFTIKNINGSILKKVVKRGVTSSDVRVRKQSARILPINMIIPLASDRDYGVASIAASRIGISAMPELFINSKHSYFRIDAIKSLDMTREEVGSRIDSIIDNINDAGSPWHKRTEVTLLLNKLNKDDLLYFLDITKHLQLHDYFNGRINN